MENLLNILVAVLPPFLLLGLGAFARAVGWLRAEADASLSMVTIRILYPFFILFHIQELNCQLLSPDYSNLPFYQV